MRGSRRRISGVTVLAGTVLVLLPALAWLQYSWLDQIAAADRDRRERTVRTAASQLAGDLDGELNRALTGLQIDAPTVEHAAWAGYAQRYSSWMSSAATPAIVEHVYLAEIRRSSRSRDRRHRRRRQPTITLRRWDPSNTTFAAVEWPSHLEPLRERLSQSGHLEGPPGRHLERFPPLLLNDRRTLISPILRVERRSSDLNPPELRLMGLTIIQLNLDVIRRDVLPALVRRHFFDADGATEYRVAVVDRDQPDDVIYESEEGAADIALRDPDASTTLMAARLRPSFFMARGDRGDDREPGSPSGGNFVINVIESQRSGRAETLRARLFSGGEGPWRLVVKHRAGSLEAAVAATRTRNLALGSGVLALLAAAIGLLLVSARRADRLARQQIEFVASVSHELRTPVSVIGAAAGNLADGVVGDPARVKKYGAAIQTEARRLGETVERVLQLAGLAAGRGMAARTAVPPSLLVAETLDACRTEIEAAGMQVEVDVPASLPPIAGDPAALKSALHNVVSNAVKYARGGRWMRISAALARGGGRRRALGAPYVAIKIEDRGPGIASEDRKHIFEAFYRGRDAVAQQIQGSGLGLNLVQRIVEAHGGMVAVSSDTGRGTTFVLALPAAPDTEAAATVPGPAALGSSTST